MQRSTFLKTAAVAVFAACGVAAQAAEWPERPITLVVPLAAGGSTDTTARLLAQRLGEVLGQRVIVDNRTGAGGNIGSAYVARSKPDGYTLLLHASTIATNVSLYKDTGFDLRKDLIPISQVALIPNVLMVNNEVPAKNLEEFIAYVRSKKTGVNYGSAGSGTSSHLAGALFNSLSGADMVHVPYKGGAPANADLLAGQIQVVFSPLVEVLPFIDSGKLRPLAVTTTHRSTRLPNVPAVGEVLPGYEIVLWNGVFAPTNTPPMVVDKLNAGIQKVLQDPAVRKIFADQGSTVVGSTSAEFKQVLASEIDKWAKLVKLSGARVD